MKSLSSRVTQKMQQDRVLAKADSLGLKPFKNATELSTVEEWADTILILPDDHNVIRDNVIKQLTEDQMTVSIILYTF